MNFVIEQRYELLGRVMKETAEETLEKTQPEIRKPYITETTWKLIEEATQHRKSPNHTWDKER